MRTLTGYGIAVIFVLAIVNGVAFLTWTSFRFHNLSVFSAGFVLCILGMYAAAWIYG